MTSSKIGTLDDAVGGLVMETNVGDGFWTSSSLGRNLGKIRRQSSGDPDA